LRTRLRNGLSGKQISRCTRRVLAVQVLVEHCLQNVRKRLCHRANFVRRHRRGDAHENCGHFATMRRQIAREREESA
jgi:hypothetical protein